MVEVPKAELVCTSSTKSLQTRWNNWLAHVKVLLQLAFGLLVLPSGMVCYFAEKKQCLPTDCLLFTVHVLYNTCSYMYMYSRYMYVQCVCVCVCASGDQKITTNNGLIMFGFKVTSKLCVFLCGPYPFTVICVIFFGKIFSDTYM